MTLTARTPGAMWRRVLVSLAALAGVALTLSLGFWQLGRAHTKQALAEAVRLQASQPALTAADWPCRAHDASSLPLQRPVLLRGQWVHDRTVLLDNRNIDGRSGLIILTPLRVGGPMASGCGAGFVLVQRGWMPRDPAARRDLQHLPAWPQPSGTVEVRGRLVAEPSRVYQIADEPVPQGPGPLLRQNADPAFWARWLGQPPLAGTVLQLQAEAALPEGQAVHPTGLDDGLWRQWPAVDHGEGKHLAYAAQWFAMAATLTGLYVWYQVIRPRRAAARRLAHVGQ